MLFRNLKHSLDSFADFFRLGAELWTSLESSPAMDIQLTDPVDEMPLSQRLVEVKQLRLKEEKRLLEKKKRAMYRQKNWMNTEKKNQKREN